ncbi:hypothetical protein K504DRAFT_224068 [Pleomassaria siparia CBS 279.74]|uniref:Uncharacterized protein n=1 Tax=Pleomassaria siparia CBS 279.74 TaxID=1314801 RepID=A0A6G1KFG5_9PLEO|nr:hypothetical protein K504DRAFT_224068 [Pleomassaria siparia CBS 279.74]
MYASFRLMFFFWEQIIIIVVIVCLKYFPTLSTIVVMVAVLLAQALEMRQIMTIFRKIIIEFITNTTVLPKVPCAHTFSHWDKEEEEEEEKKGKREEKANGQTIVLPDRILSKRRRAPDRPL